MILIITLIIIPVILKVAVHSELLHLVWVLVTLLSLQDCVSILFITGGVRSYPVFINVYNNTQKVLILLNIWSRGKITVFDASKRLYVHSTLKSITQIVGSNRSSRNAVAHMFICVAQSEHYNQIHRVGAYEYFVLFEMNI